MRSFPLSFPSYKRENQDPEREVRPKVTVSESLGQESAPAHHHRPVNDNHPPHRAVEALTLLLHLLQASTLLPALEKAPDS